MHLPQNYYKFLREDLVTCFEAKLTGLEKIWIFFFIKDRFMDSWGRKNKLCSIIDFEQAFVSANTGRYSILLFPIKQIFEKKPVFQETFFLT